MARDRDAIKDIYKENKHDDMTRLERRKRHKFRRFFNQLFGFLAVALITFVISWYFLAGRGTFNGQGVKLSIVGPDQVSSGNSIDYIINYANSESVALRTADLSVKFPDGFVLESATPKPTSGESKWSFGGLTSGQSGKVLLKGKLVGEKNTTKVLTAVFSYVPANFSSEFRRTESLDTVIKETPISLKIEGPTNALAGDKVIYTVRLKNSGDVRFTNLKLTATYPDNFVFSQASVAPDEDTTVWNIGGLDGQENREIKIEGNIGSAAEGSLDFKWELGSGSGKTYVAQAQTHMVTDVVKGALSLNLIVNGSNESKGVAFGDVLNFSIPYKNNSDTRLSELNIKLTLNSFHTLKASGSFGFPIWELASFKDSNKGTITAAEISPRTGVIDSRLVTWTKKEVKNLTYLDPGEEGKLEFSLRLKSFDDLKGLNQIGSVDDLALESFVEMSIGKTGNLKSSTVMKSGPIINALNTNLKLVASGRYYDESGVALGSGPLPPQSGRTTNYRVFWAITNDIHEVRDISVSAVLPAEVAWNNKFDIGAGDMSYDPSRRTVTWKVNRLPLSVPKLSASFEVGLTPLPSQVGKVVILVPLSTITATDTKSQSQISLTISAVSTDLPSDSRASGKGVVLKGEALIR